jgi:hypothetical protein
MVAHRGKFVAYFPVSRDRQGKSGLGLRVVPSAVVAAGMTVSPAWTQANLDAGKSAEQIFSNACNACHRSPREIKPTSAAFLREHYTTGAREAAAMAAYLSSVGSDAQAVQQRPPPKLGAGRAPSPAVDQPKPGDAQAAQPRNGRTQTRQPAGGDFEE